ncbi:MAG TPA: hypothetical protein VJI70_03640 [Candidatus Paceibacterota bacterium]
MKKEQIPDALTGRDEHVPQVDSLGEVAKREGVCEPIFDDSKTPQDPDSGDVFRSAQAARDAGM